MFTRHRHAQPADARRVDSTMEKATRGREGTASSRAVKLLLLTKRHGRRPCPPGACHMSKPPRDYTSFGSNTYFVAAGCGVNARCFKPSEWQSCLSTRCSTTVWKANTCSTNCGHAESYPSIALSIRKPCPCHAVHQGRILVSSQEGTWIQHGNLGTGVPGTSGSGCGRLRTSPRIYSA